MPQKVIALSLVEITCVRYWSTESRSLGVERKKGGNHHPWLNIDKRSIANKYPEGKFKSTSKGELKDLKSLRGKRVAVTQVVVQTVPKQRCLFRGLNPSKQANQSVLTWAFTIWHHFQFHWISLGLWVTSTSLLYVVKSGTFTRPVLKHGPRS